jgi:hypothetical protein
MSKRMNYLILALMFVTTSGLQAADASNQSQSQASSNKNKIENEKYEILNRDRIDQTDVYEIPFGDSEVEEEEQINRAEKKDTFKLPSAK